MFLPNFLFNPYFKKFLFPFLLVISNFRRLIPPSIREEDFLYVHILLFMELYIVLLFNQIKKANTV